MHRRDVADRRDRRSIVLLRDLPSGAVISRDDVDLLRPGTGLPPKLLDVVVGSPLARDVAADTPLTLEDLHG